ncbi:hypothetical protein QAD02_017583 [Eretmocerus hayati]|uniref:Uncharacterized protein n=1 Tax=Eretmocerus hayati TaxID=131215 RepID=A0ACC2PG50_9HYME|nr:hypothetical protein QAD02_017583 [Eretmocerus hayati]
MVFSGVHREFRKEPQRGLFLTEALKACFADRERIPVPFEVHKGISAKTPETEEWRVLFHLTWNRNPRPGRKIEKKPELVKWREFTSNCLINLLRLYGFAIVRNLNPGFVNPLYIFLWVLFNVRRPEIEAIRKVVERALPLQDEEIDQVVSAILTLHSTDKQQVNVFDNEFCKFDEKDMKELRGTLRTDAFINQAADLINKYPGFFCCKPDEVAGARFFFLMSECLGYVPEDVPSSALVYGPRSETENIDPADLKPRGTFNFPGHPSTEVQNLTTQRFFEFKVLKKNEIPTRGSIKVNV